MPRRRAFFNRYKPPGTDSARARAAAIMFLTNARSIDGLTIETFAHRQKLSTATAAKLLADELARRKQQGERT